MVHRRGDEVVSTRVGPRSLATDSPHDEIDIVELDGWRLRLFRLEGGNTGPRRKSPEAGPSSGVSRMR